MDVGCPAALVFLGGGGGRGLADQDGEREGVKPRFGEERALSQGTLGFKGQKFTQAPSLSLLVPHMALSSCPLPWPGATVTFGGQACGVSGGSQQLARPQAPTLGPISCGSVEAHFTLKRAGLGRCLRRPALDLSLRGIWSSLQAGAKMPCLSTNPQVVGLCSDGTVGTLESFSSPVCPKQKQP